MQTTTIAYPSRDGRSTVHALLWEPDARTADAPAPVTSIHGVPTANVPVRTASAGDPPTADAAAPTVPATAAASPRGLIQIVHGMAEHIDRYEPFACFLTDHGFAVCANDHVGHGLTAATSRELGHIPLRAGEDVLIEDVHELRRRACEHLAGRTAPRPDAPAASPAVATDRDAALASVPYAIFGHSMGSYVTRVYLTRHAFGVRAAVLCGTGQEPWVKTAAGLAVTRLMAAVAGERHVSALVHAIGPGGYARQMGHGAGGNDWIAADPAVVRAFDADPLSGQRFTVGGYHTLSRLVADARNPRLAAAIPKGLPLLFIAGDEDLVGRRGAGVAEAAAEYRRLGVEVVDERLYHGYRHEILNEPIGGRVMGDVLAWLGERGL